jgi:hypothetical protein
MDNSKDDLIQDILNLEDMLNIRYDITIGLNLNTRKHFYNNFNIIYLTNKRDDLIRLLSRIFVPSSSQI